MSVTKSIKIGGKKRPVHYGYWALAQFGDKTGTTLVGLIEIASNLTFSNLITLVHVGLKDGARIDKVPFLESEDEVADWLDATPAARQQFIDFFSESMAKIFPDEEGDEKSKEGNLKRSPGMQSRK